MYFREPPQIAMAFIHEKKILQIIGSFFKFKVPCFHYIRDCITICLRPSIMCSFEEVSVWIQYHVGNSRIEISSNVKYT